MAMDNEAEETAGRMANRATDEHRVIIMNGFSEGEIMAIMRQVKALCRDGNSAEKAIDADRRDLIFAKTTPNSLETRLGDLIADLAGDHAYLRQNPPPQRGTPA